MQLYTVESTFGSQSVYAVDCHASTCTRYSVAFKLVYFAEKVRCVIFIIR